MEVVIINMSSVVAVKNESGTGQKLSVAVQFYGSIKAAAGCQGGEIEIPAGFVVFELLKLLSGVYGDALKKEVFQPGEDPGEDDLRDDLIVTVNSVIADHLKTKSIKIENGDTVALFPAFPGGG